MIWKAFPGRRPESPGPAPSIAEPALQAPEYLAQSAWTEHIPFAFWLVAALRPDIFVELGVHYGTSYFAFCQEIRRQGLATRAYAVDTWKGDAHAGFYGEDVWEAVSRHNRETYPTFSSLVRDSFGSAVSGFEDGSIDLLHIDGLHSFEAVSADFRTWLPKLSRRAVVLLHDSQVRERDFGVFRLVESLRDRHPLFEFSHGYGLAVVGVGPDQSPALRALFEAETDPGRKRSVEATFARLGRTCLLEMDKRKPGPAGPEAPGGADPWRGKPHVRGRSPAREVVHRAIVTPGRRQPASQYSGEAYRADGTLCPLSVRPSARAAYRHVPFPPGRASARMAGHYLYAGPLFGIFGHDLVELAGRLWPLLTERFDGIVAQKWTPAVDAFQLKLDHTIETVLGAFGIGFHDIHVVEAPVEVEYLTVPEPALYINDFGLPILGDCYRLIADHYRSSPVFHGKGFYISRTRAGSSRVANEPELEEAARRAGLQVLHPQRFSLPVQIALMRQAEVIVGTDGSAMHLAAFARPGTRVLCFDTRNLANQRIIGDVSHLDSRYVKVAPGEKVGDVAAHLGRVTDPQPSRR
jgi:Glycosyltransferase 61/Methyltransferase domain